MMIVQTEENELHLVDQPFSHNDSIARANQAISVCGEQLGGRVHATRGPVQKPYPDWVCGDCAELASS